MESQVKFHGRGGEFFGIWIVNILLSIITLGIYSAWAKVRTKKYLHGNTEIAGERFEYLATPIQILIGRIVAFVCVVIWVVSSQFFPVFSGGLVMLFLLVMPWLIRNNIRFDTRMTRYRNVRFDFTGSLKGAYWAFLGRGLIIFLLFSGLVFTPFWLGDAADLISVVLFVAAVVVGFFGYAWTMAGMVRFVLNNIAYGKQTFSAIIETRFYIKTFLLAALVAFLILAIAAVIGFFTVGSDIMAMIASGNEGQEPGTGFIASVIALYLAAFLGFMVVSAFITVRTWNYIFAQATVGSDPEITFRSSMEVGSYLWLVVSNFFIQLFTLGLARPWVIVRTSRYLADITVVVGDVEALAVKDHEGDAKSSIADELAQAFDVNIGLG